MTDKTLQKMYKRRMGFKDYIIYFLLAVIIFGGIGYETRTRELETRLEDHRAFVDGLAGLNEGLKMEMAKDITSQVIDSLKMDIKADEYMRGYDKAMLEANPPTLNVTAIGGVE